MGKACTLAAMILQTYLCPWVAALIVWCYVLLKLCKANRVHNCSTTVFVLNPECDIHTSESLLRIELCFIHNSSFVALVFSMLRSCSVGLHNTLTFLFSLCSTVRYACLYVTITPLITVNNKLFGITCHFYCCSFYCAYVLLQYIEYCQQQDSRITVNYQKHNSDIHGFILP